MSEEVKIKMSVPMFQEGELERFDNNIHSIVEEYSKMLFKEKDQILTQRIIMKQEEEIEELKTQLQQKENIIKEVREYIENNDLYEQDYDYDYEENLVVGPPTDETSRKILLEILDKENE